MCTTNIYYYSDISLQNVSNLEMKVEVLYGCGGGNVPGGVVKCVDGMGVVDEMGRTPVVCFNEKKMGSWRLQRGK